MIVKEIKTVFNDYKKTGMLVAFPTCTFKCCHEAGIPITVCQNCHLTDTSEVDLEIYKILNRYDPSIHSALILGGLEPLDSINDLFDLILAFRIKYTDDIIIYTGYNIEEIPKYILTMFERCGNIILKVGRYIHNDTPRYDEILGVELASSNQYAINMNDYLMED